MRHRPRGEQHLTSRNALPERLPSPHPLTADCLPSLVAGVTIFRTKNEKTKFKIRTSRVSSGAISPQPNPTLAPKPLTPPQASCLSPSHATSQ